MDNEAAMTTSRAMMELSILSAEASQQEFDDVAVELLGRGIPAEIVTRLKQVWEVTKRLAGEVIALGKILVGKILEFVRAHPGLAIGLAIGAAAAAMVASIPILGSILAPITSVAMTAYGAGVGATIDNNAASIDPFSAAVGLAKAFFEFLATIFNGIVVYWMEK